MTKRRLTTVILVAGVAALLLRVATACVDVEPVVVVRDAATPTNAPCLACLEQPGNCVGELDRCQQEPRCLPVYECMVAQKCLDQPTLDDKIKCGLPCAQEAGIVTVDDPIVSDYLLTIVACGQRKCAVPCNLVDGSFGL